MRALRLEFSQSIEAVVARSSPDRSVEQALLRAAMRAFVKGEGSSELAALTSRRVDWDWILRQAEAERVAALLYSAARSLAVPSAVLHRLHAAWVGAQRQYLLGVRQLTTLLALLEGQGVSAIPLRGPALAEMLYRDPALRPFTDLDLLICEGDLPQALGLLSVHGYRPREGGSLLAHGLAWRHAASFVSDTPGEIPIDLHWGLVDYPGMASAAAIPHPELWDRAVRVEGPEGVRWGLCPADLLISLALHWVVHHALSGLIWQLDLALLVARSGGTLDWNGVVERACRWRTRGPVILALRQVRRRLEVAAPAWVLDQLRPPGVRLTLLDWLCRRREEHRERLEYLVPLLGMDRGADLLRAIAIAAVPTARWLRCRYGKASVFGAYLTHCARMGRIVTRTARAALGRGR